MNEFFLTHFYLKLTIKEDNHGKITIFVKERTTIY